MAPMSTRSAEGASVVDEPTPTGRLTSERRADGRGKHSGGERKGRPAASTGAPVGMMDAKAALTEAAGDFDRAIEMFRERGLAASAKRADRTETEGAVGVIPAPPGGAGDIGAMVELAAETDFVAKSDEFSNAANEIAKHVSWANPTWLGGRTSPKTRLEEERRIATVRPRTRASPSTSSPGSSRGGSSSSSVTTCSTSRSSSTRADFEGSVGEMVTQLGTRMGENISVTRFARLPVGER